MNALTSQLIRLHGREGLRAEQWFDLMIDDVLAGFGLRLAPEDTPSEPFRAMPSPAVMDRLVRLAARHPGSPDRPGYR